MSFQATCARFGDNIAYLCFETRFLDESTMPLCHVLESKIEQKITNFSRYQNIFALN